MLLKKTNKPKVIKYRSVYWVKLGRTVGAEIYKTRPCVVMNNDWQNTIGQRVVIIPLTTTPMPNIPFHISIEFVRYYQNKFAQSIRNELVRK